MKIKKNIKLKIAIVSGIIHPKYGGPVSVIDSHVTGLSRHAEVSIFAVCDKNEKGTVYKKYKNIRIYDRGFPAMWYMGKGLLRDLIKICNTFDIIHAHMLWDYPVLAACIAAHIKKKPLIITPHGTLIEKWRYNSLHKYLYLKIVLKYIFRNTTFLHALNKEEEEAIIGLGIKCAVRVVPNGLPIDKLNENNTKSEILKLWPTIKNKRVMISIGRISPEKRIDRLLKIWSNAMKIDGNRNWLLVLAGSGDKKYEKYIIKLVNDLRINDFVLMTGFVTGKLKYSLLKASECFIIVSKSEGLSMAILEAMAVGLPIAYTKTCNFPEIQLRKAGWELDSDKENIEKKVQKILFCKREELLKFGEMLEK